MRLRLPVSSLLVYTLHISLAASLLLGLVRAFSRNGHASVNCMPSCDAASHGLVHL